MFLFLDFRANSKRLKKSKQRPKKKKNKKGEFRYWNQFTNIQSTHNIIQILQANIKKQIMETLKFLFTFFMIFCLKQHVESATTFSLKKTAGQLLDETFLVLRRDLKSLENVDNDLKTKVEKISEDIKTLKLIHGKCAPCLSIKTTNKYCDCTNHPPKKDCLEFKKAGFKVRTTFVKNILSALFRYLCLEFSRIEIV